MYVRELCVRYRQRRLSGRQPVPSSLHAPADAAALLQRLLDAEPVEVCGVLCLSARRGFLAYHELSRGTIDAASLHPRDVFRTALLAHARSVIVGHNHPSGDPTPTPEDVAVTRRLAEAGALIGVDLVDHIIVAGTDYVSLRAGAFYTPVAD